MTFKHAYVTGEARLDDIDDFVDRWHDSDSKKRLSEYLGMSEDEYRLFIEDREQWENHMVTIKMNKRQENTNPGDPFLFWC